jgi:cathepsin C
MLLFLLPLALADLPVHCMRAQVLGKWDLAIGPSSPKRSACGHQRPDSPGGQPKREIPANAKNVTVTFADKGANKIVVQSGGQETYFSMVYDEGFEFEHDGKAFFAFSAYDLKPSLAGGKPVNQSRCEQTEVGWYTSKDRSEFGCWIGHKVQPEHALVRTEEPRPAEEHPKEPKEEHPAFKEPKTKAEHEHKVALINERATTWRAKAFDQYVGTSYADLSRFAGHRRASPRGVLAPEHLSFLAKARVRVEESDALQHSAAKVKALPKDFDWRTPNGTGTSVLEPVMDQGDCGSCYAVATLRMLSARHRINTGSEIPFSISYPLYCSEYNQGCEGGFSNLVSRWSQDVGLVPATCARYNTHGSCSYTCDDQGPSTGFRADAHRYIGGYYGKANAGEMMEELKNNGPFAVGVRVADDFMYYSEGVYQGPKLEPIEQSDGWQEMQHAVLLVGWGETPEGIKYWTIQNSWDEYWGEDGFMRLLRGENDSGVESSPEAADVVRDETNGSRVKFLNAEQKH